MSLDVRQLRFQLRVTQVVLALTLVSGLGLVAAHRDAPVVEDLRVRRLVVIDDRDVPRLVLGQDPKDGQRRSRAAGLTIHDAQGNERGGFSTMEDGSVVLAMDAPAGVGAAMRDRLGMVVHPDGSSYIMLIDNKMGGVVRLDSDGAGDGGLKLFKWDWEGKKVHTRAIDFDGETTSARDIK